jgi:hypothetical protein
MRKIAEIVSGMIFGGRMRLNKGASADKRVSALDRSELVFLAFIAGRTLLWNTQTCEGFSLSCAAGWPWAASLLWPALFR